MIGDLDRAAIEALLGESRIARLAVHPLSSGDYPILVPIPCFYQDGAFYVLSGPGQKIEAMRRNPNVALEIDRFRATNDWKSVIVRGRYHELSTASERRAAITAIETISGEPLVIGENSILFRVTPVSMSGRFERPE